MRRHALQITVALLTFAVGFLTSDRYENLAYALPLSLLAFFIAKVLPRLEIDFHFLMVATMSVLLWAAGASAFFSIFSVSGGSCVLEFSDERGDPATDLSDDARLPLSSTPLSEVPNYSCGRADISPLEVNSVWAGVMDKKVVVKPAPHYPPIAEAAHAEGLVVVWVMVDESGKVVWAQATSGHPLLREPATRAACSARFSPPLMNGPPVRVSGVLTYNFVFK
jgi:TonB family protein